MTVIEFPTHNSKNHKIQIAFDGKVAVTIRPDGSVEFGEDYSPDEAATAFWLAVGRNHPWKVQ